jgi:cyclopropane fatty-acyl-phospholipid synthase-like methyltransferase
VALTRTNDKLKIQQHYDLVSPYYHSLWGEHLHHGYWIHGDETKEAAQIQLIEHLAALANIRAGGEILDVGCGFGASSIFLAKKYRVRATGITISSVQVEMANQAAAQAQVPAKFLLMDAEAMQFPTRFDVVWSVESVSHYQNTARFFASAAQLLTPGGTLALLDWFKQDHLLPQQYKGYIQPIERGMLVELQTMGDYETQMESNGLQIERRENLSLHVSKTWDLCLEIIKNKMLWELAAKHGAEFIQFLQAFRAMRAGFASGHFVYGLLVAKNA